MSISSAPTSETSEIHPFPIFDSVDYYHTRSWSEGPVRAKATRLLSLALKDTPNADWSPIYLEIADQFLCNYLNGYNGPTNTFNRFKNEIERFTLWLVIEHKKNPMELEPNDISNYIDFLESPKKTWVSAYNTTRLITDGEEVMVNPNWLPFWARRPKEIKLPSLKSKDPVLREQRRQSDSELIAAYSLGHSSLGASLRALSPFYNFLIDQQKQTETQSRRTGTHSGLISPCMSTINPVPAAAKKLRKQYSIPNPELAKGKSNRLTQRQWDFIINALISLRDAPNATELQRKKWIRSLFMMTFMKANMLRVSEVCKSAVFSPKMGDIKKTTVHSENRKYWEYSFIGKGSVRRKVVLPEGLLTYLADYRRSRGLTSDYPEENDKAPLLSHLKADLDSKGKIVQERPLTYGATCDQIQLVFDKAAQYVEQQASKLGVDYKEDILALRQASTHWLRHTGAIMALEDGEDVSCVSDTLGHTDSRITDQIYNDHNAEDNIKSVSRRRV